jgi:hypothetical protein
VVTQLFYEVDRYLQVGLGRAWWGFITGAFGAALGAWRAPRRRPPQARRRRGAAASTGAPGGAQELLPGRAQRASPTPNRPLPPQFVKDCRSIGIDCPILPGIMPIMTYGGFKVGGGGVNARGGHGEVAACSAAAHHAGPLLY